MISGEQPKTVKQCKQCKKSFQAWKTTLVFCSNTCTALNVKAHDDEYSRLTHKLADKALESLVFRLYVDTGSLRKVLAALPKEHAHKLDLKSVHVIIRKFQRSIKYSLDQSPKSIRVVNGRAKTTDTKWSMDNIGQIVPLFSRPAAARRLESIP